MINLPAEFAAAFMTLVLLAYIFWPESTFATQHERTRLDYLFERKDQLFENLRDLNFEFRAGKYPEEDFQALRAELEIEASKLMVEIVDLQRD
jgi:hypothetical protein